MRSSSRAQVRGKEEEHAVDEGGSVVTASDMQRIVDEATRVAIAAVMANVKGSLAPTKRAASKGIAASKVRNLLCLSLCTFLNVHQGNAKKSSGRAEDDDESAAEDTLASGSQNENDDEGVTQPGKLDPSVIVSIGFCIAYRDVQIPR